MITLSVSPEEFTIISNALNFRAGSMLSLALREPEVMEEMEAINDLGFKLDEQASEQE